MTSGRHPCAGMKVAKLEMKLILGLMLLGYQYELVDDSGKTPESLPQPDRNDLLMVSCLIAAPRGIQLIILLRLAQSEPSVI